MDEVEQAKDRGSFAGKCRIYEQYPKCVESGLATKDNCVQELSFAKLQDGPDAKIKEESVDAELE